METLSTTIEVMDALGGTSAVAKLTARNYPAAFAWRRANRFPSNTFLVLTSALAKKGKTAPKSLWRMPEAVAA